MAEDQDLGSKLKKFEWNEPMQPLVTKCCVSFCWAEVMAATSSGGGTLCYQCRGVVKDNLRFATEDEINNRHIIADMAILQKQYNSLMNKLMDIIKNHKNHGKDN